MENISVNGYKKGNQFKMADLRYAIESIGPITHIVKCKQCTLDKTFPTMVYVDVNQLDFVTRLSPEQALIDQIDEALSRYYAHFNREYDTLFKTYCEDNGFDIPIYRYFNISDLLILFLINILVTMVYADWKTHWKKWKRINRRTVCSLILKIQYVDDTLSLKTRYLSLWSL